MPNVRQINKFKMKTKVDPTSHVKMSRAINSESILNDTLNARTSVISEPIKECYTSSSGTLFRTYPWSGRRFKT